MIGQTIGNYKILEKLNEGGMGAVYKAIDTALDRVVAIKVLRPELARQSSVIERFRSEALTLARLNHPNIATLHSFFDQGDELFMILEFVPGETLDKVLQRRGALSWQEAIPIFNELLDSIDHAHEFGVIHRDIKPANIMLTDKGALKVLDFGIARFHGRAKITRVGNILGTLEYMSPEQAKGEETDVRSDVYSLGMTLYEILTGRTPFETENDFELIQKQIKETPLPPRAINPDIPEAIEAAIIKAYSKDPDERFQTAGEFRQTLRDAYSGLLSETICLSDSSEKIAISSQSFGVSQTAVMGAAFQEMCVDSPETPTVEIVRDNRFYVSGGDYFKKENSVEETQFAENPLPRNRGSKEIEMSGASPSFLSFFARKHYGAGVVGIFVLVILGAASAFFYFTNEKSRAQFEGEQNQLKAENKVIVENKTIENKTQVKEQKKPIAAAQTSLPSTAKVSLPVEPHRAKTISSQRSIPGPAAKPRNPVTTKKKEPRASEAAQLRQAEKLLTGN